MQFRDISLTPYHEIVVPNNPINVGAGLPGGSANGGFGMASFPADAPDEGVETPIGPNTDVPNEAVHIPIVPPINVEMVSCLPLF